MPARKRKRKWTPAKIAAAAERHGVTVAQFKAYLRARREAAAEHLQ